MSAGIQRSLKQVRDEPREPAETKQRALTMEVGRGENEQPAESLVAPIARAPAPVCLRRPYQCRIEERESRDTVLVTAVGSRCGVQMDHVLQARNPEQPALRALQAQKEARQQTTPQAVSRKDHLRVDLRSRDVRC